MVNAKTLGHERSESTDVTIHEGARTQLRRPAGREELLGGVISASGMGGAAETMTASAWISALTAPADRWGGAARLARWPIDRLVSSAGPVGLAESDLRQRPAPSGTATHRDVHESAERGSGRYRVIHRKIRLSGLLIRWQLTAGPHDGAAMAVRRGDLHSELSLHTAFCCAAYAAESPACPCLSVDPGRCPVRYLSVTSVTTWPSMTADDIG
jgi:hypothetical protein